MWGENTEWMKGKSWQERMKYKINEERQKGEKIAMKGWEEQV